jgi:DNA-binding MarR family transcriptional regulator
MMIDVTRTIRHPDSLPEGSADPDIIERIIVDFRAAMSQMKCAASDRLVRLGISMAQLNIMYTLQRSGEMTMSHLADVLNVSLSSATGLVDRMEERGFVERSRVPEDRRVVLVRIAPGGERMMAEHESLTDDVLRTVLQRIDPAQLAGVAEASAALRGALEASANPAWDRHPGSAPDPRSS